MLNFWVFYTLSLKKHIKSSNFLDWEHKILSFPEYYDNKIKLANGNKVFRISHQIWTKINLNMQLLKIR